MKFWMILEKIAIALFVLMLTTMFVFVIYQQINRVDGLVIKSVRIEDETTVDVTEPTEKIVIITEEPFDEVVIAEIETTAETPENEPQAVEEVYTDIYTTKPIEEVATAENGFLGTFYITGYTAEEGFYEGKTTASGCGVGYGQCAMNNAQRVALGLKYGDTITVDGLGTYTLTDCGCGYGVIDIWCDTNAEAYGMTGYYTVFIGG